MSKRKLDAKAFSQQKRKRRQWLTFVRMCRYGVNNLTRNAWLTIAATAVMTITLLIIFTTLVARNVLLDTVGALRNNVDFSIYVKSDTSAEDAKAIQVGLEKLSSVRKVTYADSEAGRKELAQAHKDDAGTLGAINMATNKVPGTFNVKPVDINKTDELKKFTDTNPILKKDIDPDHPPSFAGPKKVTIEKIGRFLTFTQTVGLIASIVFMAISSLIVFNTIRMAIFNRKDEIQMMKLIGADRNFIRGPFVVEAIVYGSIAAIIATGLGIALMYAAHDTLSSYEVNVQSTLAFIAGFWPLIVLAMIILGGLIGTISSLLATRRYLKI